MKNGDDGMVFWVVEQEEGGRGGVGASAQVEGGGDTQVWLANALRGRIENTKSILIIESDYLSGVLTKYRSEIDTPILFSATAYSELSLIRTPKM